MRISTLSAENQKGISLARRQITNSSDLRKFDEFLSKHSVLDFADENLAKAASNSCFGPESCKEVNFNFHISIM